MKVTLGKKLECLRCGHKWVPRKDDVRTCPNPKCRSVHWDRPRQIEVIRKPQEPKIYVKGE